MRRRHRAGWRGAAPSSTTTHRGIVFPSFAPRPCCSRCCRSASVNSGGWGPSTTRPRQYPSLFTPVYLPIFRPSAVATCHWWASEASVE